MKLLTAKLKKLLHAISGLFGPVDMTVGTPWKKIVLFTVPMLLGNIAQQLYNTVDSIIVGKYVGDNALAAVGSAGPISVLRSQKPGRPVLYHWKQYFACAVCQHFCSGFRLAGDQTAAAAVKYAGYHYRLVRFVSVYFVYRRRRTCVL